MKVIIIYSGKGGVGKTTTTSNVAKTLAAQKQKVFILDADVNTPSMPVIFENENPNKYTKVCSLGYGTQNSIYVTNSAIRSYIKDAINSINEWKPDYVLIDTPPSITDVHINLLEKIKPSGLIIVSQPNPLSITDVNRTSLFFQQRGVNILGIIENMVTEKAPAKYSWKLLGSIPFAEGFNFNKVYADNKKTYQAICDSIKNIDSVVLENKHRAVFDETITEEDINSLPLDSRNDLRFINLSTWEYVKELIEDSEQMLHGYDKFLEENTTERLTRMIKAFETDERALFMVTKAPACAIQLLPGEIGEGSITVAKSYYGVPRIKYSTSQGEITLFAHEIKPISNTELLRCLKDGYVATKDGRYLPKKEDLREVEACFGSRVGLSENWETHYDNIMAGNLAKVEDTVIPQQIDEIQELPTNVKRVRSLRRGTIGAFAIETRFRKKY